MRGDSSGAETAVTLKETKREKETKFRKEGARSTVEGGRREEEGRQGVREAGRNGGGDIDESPVARSSDSRRISNIGGRSTNPRPQYCQ